MNMNLNSPCIDVENYMLTIFHYLMDFSLPDVWVTKKISHLPYFTSTLPDADPFPDLWRPGRLRRRGPADPVRHGLSWWQCRMAGWADELRSSDIRVSQTGPQLLHQGIQLDIVDVPIESSRVHTNRKTNMFALVLYPHTCIFSIWIPPSRGPDGPGSFWVMQQKCACRIWLYGLIELTTINLY